MKTVTILSLLLLASSAFGELTKEDLRTIVKEEGTASEKRTREYIDLKIDALDKSLNARIDALDKSLNARIDAVDKSLNTRMDAVDKKLDWVWYMIIALIGLITAAIAVPQIIIAYRDRGQKEMQIQIDQLREKIEALQSTPS
ncbi:hypothetical protein J4G02_12115 [Candidatus Poribacteria bacterium]|nr:hypothetical protein [Candidatus Poribacteria bacterium]